MSFVSVLFNVSSMCPVHCAYALATYHVNGFPAWTDCRHALQLISGVSCMEGCQKCLQGDIQQCSLAAELTEIFSTAEAATGENQTSWEQKKCTMLGPLADDSDFVAQIQVSFIPFQRYLGSMRQTVLKTNC